jgi:hypothetical protein
MTKTESERLRTVNEIKIKLLDLNLENDPASKVLWRILDNYVKNGEPLNTILKFKMRYDTEKHYVVELYNKKGKKDVVLIRSGAPPSEKNDAVHP